MGKRLQKGEVVKGTIDCRVKERVIEFRARVRGKRKIRREVYRCVLK